MNKRLQAELDRLQTTFANRGLAVRRNKPAGEKIFQKIKAATSVVFDEVTREFFQFSNGSKGETWGAVDSDQIQPLEFLSLEDALEKWKLFAPYDKSVYDEWNVTDKKRDPRIRPSYIRHKLWFPLAEFNGGSTTVLYDADPARKGRHGQIIVYQHDPDAVSYVASDFLEFLKQSNNLLAKNADEFLPEPPKKTDEIWDVCKDGDLKRLMQLLDGGTPLDIQRELFGDKISLLEHAATYGQLSIVRHLVDRGVPIGEGLVNAAEMGQLAVVKFLLTLDPAPDGKRTTYGETPLMRAARFGHLPVVKFLLAQGADSSLKNEDGQTAVDLVDKFKHADVAALLQPPTKKKAATRTTKRKRT